MSSSSGCLLEPATGFAGSSMTIASSRGLDCASASVSWASRVYWSNSLLNEAVFGSTALAGRGGGHVTCLAAAHFAASFHVMPWIVFSDCCLANGLMTSVMHSEVRPACLLSQWRTVVIFFTLLSKFSLITIELEPDVLVKAFYMTVVMVYDKRYSCLSKLWSHACVWQLLH